MIVIRHINNTYSERSYIVILCDVGLPQVFLYLRVPVCNNAAKSHTVCPEEIKAPPSASLPGIS